MTVSSIEVAVGNTPAPSLVFPSPGTSGDLGLVLFKHLVRSCRLAALSHEISNEKRYPQCDNVTQLPTSHTLYSMEYICPSPGTYMPTSTHVLLVILGRPWWRPQP